MLLRIATMEREEPTLGFGKHSPKNLGCLTVKWLVSCSSRRNNHFFSVITGRNYRLYSIAAIKVFKVSVFFFGRGP